MLYVSFIVQQCIGVEVSADLSNTEYQELCSLSQVLLLKHLSPQLLKCEALVLLLRELITCNLFVPIYLKLSRPTALIASIVSMLCPNNSQRKGSKAKLDSTDSLTADEQSALKFTHELYLQKLKILTDDSTSKNTSEMYSKTLLASNKRSGKKIMWADADATAAAGRSVATLVQGKYVLSTLHKKSRSPNDFSVQETLLKPQRWKKNPFCKGIVDGIKEEDYCNYRIGARSTPYPSPVGRNCNFLNRQKFMSKSRPTSPVQQADEFGIDALNSSGLLQRSRSWASIATESWVDDEQEAVIDPLYSETGSQSNLRRRSLEKQSQEHLNLYSWNSFEDNSYRLTLDKRPQLVKMNSFDNNDESADVFDKIRFCKSASEDVTKYNTSLSFEGAESNLHLSVGTKLSTTHIKSNQSLNSGHKKDTNHFDERDNMSSKYSEVSCAASSYCDILLQDSVDSNESQEQNFQVYFASVEHKDGHEADVLNESVDTSMPRALNVSEECATPCRFESVLQTNLQKMFNSDNLESLTSPISSYPLPPPNDDQISDKITGTVSTQDVSFFQRPLELFANVDTLFDNNLEGDNFTEKCSEKIPNAQYEGHPFSLQTSKSCHNLTAYSRPESAEASGIKGCIKESLSSGNLLSLQSAADGDSVGSQPRSIIPGETCTSATPQEQDADAAADNSEDLSPIYEDCSNLESSIAKLRCVYNLGKGVV